MMLINNTVGVALNGALLLAYNETAEWPARLQQVLAWPVPRTRLSTGADRRAARCRSSAREIGR
jgi:hypothetical protein